MQNKLDALALLAGRELSVQDITALVPLILVRDDVGIANILSEGRTPVQSHTVGIGTVLEVMSPYGGDFLNVLEACGATDSNAKWELKLLERGEFDIGRKATRDMVLRLAAGNSDWDQVVQSLLQLAEVASPIHYNEVSDVLNRADGLMTL